MNRTAARLLAAGGALLLGGLAAAPAAAADVVSRAEANALTASLAGTGQGTGTVEATYDGQERVTGETRPPAAPFSQQLVDLGVLTQQATAGDGSSAACAGAAGAGGGIVQIGDGSCLTPGRTVSGSLSDIGLDALDLQPPEQLPLPAELAGLLDGLEGGRAQLDALVDQAVAAVDGPAGPLGLSLDFTAVEGRCRVEGGSVSGAAGLADAGIVLRAGDQEVEVVDLPADPAPDTEVTTDLSAVADALLGALSTQFRTGLDGATGPLAEATDQVRDGLVTALRDDLDGQLAPLRDTLLRVTLNEQRRPTSDSIEVTALHAEVLPAAAAALDASLADVRLGNVGCGPADRVAAEAAPAAQRPVPELPTAVSAGVEHRPGAAPLPARLAETAPVVGLGLVGLLVLVAGVLGVRRHRG